MKPKFLTVKEAKQELLVNPDGVTVCVTEKMEVNGHMILSGEYSYSLKRQKNLQNYTVTILNSREGYINSEIGYIRKCKEDYFFHSNSSIKNDSDSVLLLMAICNETISDEQILVLKNIHCRRCGRILHKSTSIIYNAGPCCLFLENMNLGGTK